MKEVFRGFNLSVTSLFGENPLSVVDHEESKRSRFTVSPI